MNKRKIGQEKETQVCEYLTQKGYKILHKNYRCPLGEIDLIGLDQGYLVFIEVKYRRNLNAGRPEEAVHLAKQRSLSNVALWYLSSYDIAMDRPCRFDVVAVTAGEIQIYRDAFPLR